MEPAVAFGRALRRIGKQRGLTQEELGLEADLRRTFVSALELGQRQPTLTTIVELPKVFGMLPSELMKEVASEF